MPWQKEPMKDAFTDAKSTACSSKLNRRSPNEETPPPSGGEGIINMPQGKIVILRQPPELKHLSKGRKIK